MRGAHELRGGDDGEDLTGGRKRVNAQTLFLDVLATALFAIHERQDPKRHRAFSRHGFDRTDCGSSGGYHVFDDHDAIAARQRSLDLPAGPVRFGFLAHREGLEWPVGIRARVADREVELSAREFALAEVFFRNAGQVLSREQLLSLVWGYDRDPGSNVVDVYVGYLRKKLGDDVIATVRGMGYRLRP